MKTEDNIAQVIRESLRSTAENIEAKELPELYTDEKYEIKSRKGSWTVYKRNNFTLPYFVEKKREEPGSGFCAVYKREGRAQTFFQGKISDSTIIDKVAGILSRKMLEQRPLFSRPPKSLTAENGLSYGLRVGLLFVIIVGSFIAFDYILLPRFGKEIGAGLGIGFSADIQIGNYRSILGAFLKEMLSPKHIKLLNSFYSLVTLLVLPILAGGIIYEFLGKWADKRRTKDFPQQAFSFLFGKEALAQLLAENKSIEEEKNKTALYERFTGLGMKTSKDNFEQIYNEMKGHISGG